MCSDVGKGWPSAAVDVECMTLSGDVRIPYELCELCVYLGELVPACGLMVRLGPVLYRSEKNLSRITIYKGGSISSAWLLCALANAR